MDVAMTSDIPEGNAVLFAEDMNQIDERLKLIRRNVLLIEIPDEADLNIPRTVFLAPDLLVPAPADFHLPVVRTVTVSDDKMIKKSPHFPAAVVPVEGGGASLRRRAVVKGDVFPLGVSPFVTDLPLNGRIGRDSLKRRNERRRKVGRRDNQPLAHLDLVGIPEIVEVLNLVDLHAVTLGNVPKGLAGPDNMEYPIGGRKGDRLGGGNVSNTGASGTEKKESRQKEKDKPSHGRLAASANFLDQILASRATAFRKSMSFPKRGHTSSQVDTRT